MRGRFEDRVAVITGAAGGIGRAAVERFVEEGAWVVAVDLDPAALEQALNVSEGRILPIAADVAREDDVTRFLGEAVGRYGGVDFVFNNAGIEGAVAPIEDYPTELYERVMSVNVTGVFLGIKHAIPLLRARGGGAIVNTASVAGLVASPLLPAYNASKHAVIGLTRSSAALYAKEAIRINAVCPAPIETRMMRSIEEGVSHNDPDGAKAGYLKRIPAGRYGEPHEVAALVAFLCSDEAGFINGSLYTIDGAFTPF